eukprot:c52873_g1_i1.p1 GENE.c52873_g1_i1~~c52873_g1_i1.p1  ORF type:complete len:432 (-),score=72.91 c52873_g1_i1:139-1434(-)
MLHFLRPSPGSSPFEISCNFDTHFTTQSSSLKDFEVCCSSTISSTNWRDLKLYVRAERLLVTGNSATFVDCDNQAFATNTFDISGEGVARVVGLKFSVPAVHRLSLYILERDRHQPCSLELKMRALSPLCVTIPFQVFSKRMCILERRGLGDVSIDDWPAFYYSVPASILSNLKPPGSQTFMKLRELANLPIDAPDCLREWAAKAAALTSTQRTPSPTLPESTPETPSGSPFKKRFRSDDVHETPQKYSGRAALDQTNDQRRKRHNRSSIRQPSLDVELSNEISLNNADASPFSASGIARVRQDEFSVASCSLDSTPHAGLVPTFHVEFASDFSDWSDFDVSVAAHRTHSEPIQAPFCATSADTVNFHINSQGVCVVADLRMRYEGSTLLKISLVSKSTNTAMFEYFTESFEVVSPALADFEWLISQSMEL